MVGLKTVEYAKISLKMVNHRDIAGTAEKEDEAPEIPRQEENLLHYAQIHNGQDCF